MITIYGQPQIASDHAITIITWTKKEVVTHSACYEAWRHDVLKQLRFKYKNTIDEGATISLTFNLKKKESPKKLIECGNDIIKCMVESKMFKNLAIVTPKIKQNIIEGCPNVEISY